MAAFFVDGSQSWLAQKKNINTTSHRHNGKNNWNRLDELYYLGQINVPQSKHSQGFEEYPRAFIKAEDNTCLERKMAMTIPSLLCKKKIDRIKFNQSTKRTNTLCGLSSPGIIGSLESIKNRVTLSRLSCQIITVQTQTSSIFNE